MQKGQTGRRVVGRFHRHTRSFPWGFCRKRPDQETTEYSAYWSELATGTPPQTACAVRRRPAPPPPDQVALVAPYPSVKSTPASGTPCRSPPWLVQRTL